MAKVRRGELIAGRFRLLRPLAAGGMGAVWVAHQQNLDVTVAIKFLAPALADSSQMRARFEREAKAVARLETRHVVKVLDYGVDEDTPFIAMELLQGEDLHMRLKRCGRLGLRQTASLLGQVAKGLHCAHQAGIIHRDLKPGNIFLTVVDDEEVVKLLDFGVAKVIAAPPDAEPTATDVVVGSPHYVSPEQARSNRSVDHRSDLWSLAVVLFRCVTGKSPFAGKTTADIMVRICAEPIPAPTSIAPDLPASLDAFFERALAREPGERFQSALELSQAFAEAIGEDASGEMPVAQGAVEDRAHTPGLSPSFGSRPFLNQVAPAPAGSPVASPAPAAGADEKQSGEQSRSGDAGTLTGAGAATDGLARRARYPLAWAATGAIVAGSAVAILVWAIGARSRGGQFTTGSSAAAPGGAPFNVRPEALEAASSPHSARADPPDPGTPSSAESGDGGPPPTAPALGTASHQSSAAATAAPAQSRRAATEPARRPPAPRTSSSAAPTKPGWGF